MPTKRDRSNVLQTELIVEYEIVTWKGRAGTDNVTVVSGTARLVQHSGGVISTLPFSTPKFNVNVDAGSGRLVGGVSNPRGLVDSTKDAVKSGNIGAVSVLRDLVSGNLPSGGGVSNTLSTVTLEPISTFPGTDIPIAGVESQSSEVLVDVMFVGESLTISAVPSGGLMSSISKFVSGQLNDFPEVTIEARKPTPVEAPCQDLFPELYNKIQKTATDVRESMNAGDRRISSLEDIQNEIVSEIGSGGRLSLSPPDGSMLESARDIQFDPPAVRDLTISDIGSYELQQMSQDKLENLKSRLRDIPSTVETGMSISDMEKAIQDINDKVQNLGDEECLKRFKEMMQGITDEVIQALRKMDAFIKDLKSRLSTLLEGVDIGDREIINRGVDCAEAIDQSLRNRVSNFRQDAKDFANAPEVSQTRTRMNNLLREGDEILSQIRGLPEECKPQVRNDVDSALSDIRNAGIRREIAIPCSEKHTSIYNRVKSFRDKAVNARNLPPEEIKDLVEDGRDLADDIDRNVPSGECRKEFIDTVDGSLSRLRSYTREVRIFTGEMTEGEENRQKVLTQIRNSIAQIQQSLRGDFERDGFRDR